MSVLPKFKVSVELPSYLLVNENRKSAQSDLTLTVTAKYVHLCETCTRVVIVVV